VKKRSEPSRLTFFKKIVLLRTRARKWWLKKMNSPPARRLGVSSFVVAPSRRWRDGGSSTSTETGGFRLATDEIKSIFNLKRLCLLLGFLILLVFASYQVAYNQKIYPGIKVLNLSLANLTKFQAEKSLNNFLSQKQKDSFLLIDVDHSYAFNLTTIDLVYLPQETINKAFSIGRNQTLPQNLARQFELLLRPISLQPDFKVDGSKLSQEVASLAAQLNQPLIEPSLHLEEKDGQKEVTLQPGQNGRILNQQRLTNTFKQRLTQANFEPIKLPLEELENDINDAQIEATLAKAKALIDRKVVLVVKKDRFSLTDQDLISFLNFKDSWQKEKMGLWLEELARTVNRLPQNASFKFENGRVLEFKPAKKGLSLQTQPSIDLLGEKLNGFLISREKQLTINLPLKETSPSIETSSVNDLGIEEAVSQGISFFRGSIVNRIHNVALAATKINGLLIAPGEIFSFNQAVGDISPATGFKQAYIIKDGKTILGDGGGVCQVSTTLFRAALNAGLEITERRAHAYRVSYYEQNSQPGFDATVFAPSTDLKFKNNTSAHLLIQTQTDKINKKLTVELYGRKDNRKITISKTRVWDQAPPPPDLVQDDPTLPMGTIKQIDWKSWGAKASFDYLVEKDNQILQQKTFYSSYRPWQAIFLKGTKEG